MSLAIDEAEDTFQDLQTANDPITGCSLVCKPTTDQYFITTLPTTAVRSSSTIIPSASYGDVTSSVTLQQSKFVTRDPKSISDHNSYLQEQKLSNHSQQSYLQL